MYMSKLERIENSIKTRLFISLWLPLIKNPTPSNKAQNLNGKDFMSHSRRAEPGKNPEGCRDKKKYNLIKN